MDLFVTCLSKPSEPALWQTGGLRPLAAIFGTVAMLATLAGCGGGSRDTKQATELSQSRIASVNPDQQVGAEGSSTPFHVYVDSVSGSDTGNGGTSASTPFQTLTGARNFLISQGGRADRIFLKCGSFWRDELRVGNYLLNHGAKVLPYGDCTTSSRPVISGADDFSGGWSYIPSEQVWVKDLQSAPPADGIKALFVNGQKYRVAQWPNAGATLPVVDGTVPNDGTRAILSVADSTFLQSQGVIGSSIAVRLSPYRIKSGRIVEATSSAGRLNVKVDIRNPSPSELPIAEGGSYVLQNQRWMLDAPGEYFYDEATKKLYVSATGDKTDLNNYQVEGTVRDVAVHIFDKANLEVEGLDLKRAVTGLLLQSTPGTRAADLEISDSAEVGVLAHQFPDFSEFTVGPVVVENNRVLRSGIVGIDTTYSRSRIVGNIVSDSGGTEEVGQADGGIAAGDYHGTVESASTEKTHILNNVVDGSGFHGITYRNIRGVIVEYNDVRNFCQRLSDCAGIYTWNKAPWQANQGSGTGVVRHNRVGSAKAMTTGTAGPSRDLVVGIYMDDETAGVAVSDNLVYDVHTGIFLHNASSMSVQSNRVWRPDFSAIRVTMDDRGCKQGEVWPACSADRSTGNIVSTNDIVLTTRSSGVAPALPTIRASLAFEFFHVDGGRHAIAPGRNVFSFNTVRQLFDRKAPHASIGGPTFEWYATRLVTSRGWREVNADEPGIIRPYVFTPYLVTTDATVAFNGFDTGLSPWAALPGIVDPVLSATGCTGPCIRFNKQTDNDLVVSPNFTMATNRLHVYRWTGAATTAGAVAVGASYIPVLNSTYPNNMENDQSVAAMLREVDAEAGSTFEAFFRPASTALSFVAVSIESPIEQGAVSAYFDNVEVAQVASIEHAEPWHSTLLLIADKSADMTLANCAAAGLPSNCQLTDLSGATVALPITLQAGTDRLLLWANSPYRKP